jgi:hypothetical protein
MKFLKNRIKYLLKSHFLPLALIIVKIKKYLLYKLSRETSIIKNENYKNIVLNDFKNTFFGYYDKTPFNPVDDRLMVFHANNQKPWKKPNSKVSASIILYDLEKKEIIKEISRSNAWNWQQGCRLFWLNESEIIYNKFNPENKLYYSETYNISSGKYKKHPLPIQDSYKDKYFISLSYEALNKTRPDYGYRNIYTKRLDLFSQKLIHYDLIRKEIKILCSVNDVLKMTSYYSGTQPVTFPRFNHVSISPDGRSFVFLFRFYHKYNLKHNLFLYDLNSNKYKSLIEDQMISHYSWLDNDNILLWGEISGKGDYYILNVSEGRLKCIDTCLSDGHPVSLDETYFITDTYPDINRLRKLLKINLHSGKKEILGEFFEPVKFIGETRCDLHPHPSPDKLKIHLDSLENGFRILKIINLEGGK